MERLGLTMPTQRTFELVCEVREMVERYYDLKQRVQQSELRCAAWRAASSRSFDFDIPNSSRL